RDPSAGPCGEKLGWSERFKALNGVWGVLILFTVVMGGIYLGIFTPTEAAGIGAGGAFCIAMARKSLTWGSLFD
ncbi:TRAP transporter large permease subunit, partial [uncultured Neptuniibacter sp.]